MEGETGAGILSFRPDKMLDKLELRNSSGFVDTDNLKSAMREDFLKAMDLVRGDTYMTKGDKEEYFKAAFTAYASKFEGVSDMSRLKKTAVIKEFTDMGLEPPPAISTAEAARKTAALEAEKISLTMQIRPISQKIKNPSTPEAELTSLTKKELEKKNRIAVIQQEIR